MRIRRVPEQLAIPAPASAAQVAAAASVAKLVGRPKKLSRVEHARERAMAMAESADWSQATGIHLVALFEWLHEQVYGVRTSELDAKAWAIASSTASRFVEREFGGDYGRAVAFVRWAWRREKSRLEWLEKNGRENHRRIGWRLQFGGVLVTDYRVDQASARGREDAG